MYLDKNKPSDDVGGAIAVVEDVLMQISNLPAQSISCNNHEPQVRRAANLKTIDPFLLGIVVSFLTPKDFKKFTAVCRYFARLRSSAEEITQYHPGKSLRCLTRLNFKNRKNFAKQIKVLSRYYELMRNSSAPINEDYCLKYPRIKRSIDMSEYNLDIRKKIKASEGNFYQYCSKGFERLNSLTIQGSGLRHCGQALDKMQQLNTLLIVRATQCAMKTLAEHFPANLEELRLHYHPVENNPAENNAESAPELFLEASASNSRNHFESVSFSNLMERISLSSLTAIDLQNTGITNDGLCLFSEKLPQTLSKLSLRGNRLTDSVLQKLTQNSQSLTELDLSLNRITSVGLSHILESNLKNSLEVLNISSNNLGVQGCQLLAQTLFPKLKTLGLTSINMGDEGLAALASGQSFPSLESLNISVNQLYLDREDLQSEITLFKNLTDLNLSGNRLDTPGFRSVLSSAQKLQKLNISTNSLLQASALDPLTSNEKFRSLEYLNLSNNPGIDDRKAVALLQSPVLNELEYLNIGGCGIGEVLEGEQNSYFAAHLEQIKSLNKIKTLVINGGFDRRDKEKIDAFQQRFPNLLFYCSFKLQSSAG